MPYVPVTVELPQYAVSFTVNVTLGGSVWDLKLAISHNCPGKPSVDGQRLIYRGRFLKDDEELDNLWKPDEARFVHLAVNPNAWSEALPEVPVISPATTDVETVRSFFSTDVDTSSSDAASAGLRRRHTVTVNPAAPSTLPSVPPPPPAVPYQHAEALPYIAHMHFKALRALSTDIQVPSHAASEEAGSKVLAQAVLLANGREWPAVFDEEFPRDSEAHDRVNYDFSIIDGKPFLQLRSPTLISSPAQQHAIRVLSFTFPLLTIRKPPNFTANLLEPTNVNQPPVRVRVLEVRNLFAPLFLLGLRTMLLLYFFSPARKPLFSLLIGAWVLYEAWGAIRGAFVDLNDMVANLQQGRNGAQQAAGNNGNGPNPVAARPGQRGGTGAAANTSDVVMSRLAGMNLSSEEHALAATGTSEAQEPSFLGKTWSFVSLFAMTLHPAMWNRRRLALREREQRVKNELTKRLEREPEREEQTVGGGSTEADEERGRLNELHRRRARWVREYIDRVEREEWVDE